MNEAALIFQKNLYLLITNGCTLQESLKAISTHTKHAYGKKTSQRILNYMNKGISFFESIAETKNDRLMWKHLISIGTKTGNIAHSLQISIDSLSSQKKYTTALTQTLLYPIIVIFTISLLILFLLLYGIPLLQTSGLENILSIEKEIVKAVRDCLVFLCTSGVFFIGSVSYMYNKVHRNASFWNIVSTLVENICSYSDALSIAGELYGHAPLQVLHNGFCQAIFSSSYTTGDIVKSLKLISSYCVEKRNALFEYMMPVTESIGLIIAGIIVLRISMAVFLPLFDIGLRFE